MASFKGSIILVIFVGCMYLLEVNAQNNNDGNNNNGGGGSGGGGDSNSGDSDSGSSGGILSSILGRFPVFGGIISFPLKVASTALRGVAAIL